MLFLTSLIAATIWVVLGYLVLFASTRTQGTVQKFGRVLAVWVFLIAALFPVAGAYATFSHFDPMTAIRSMHAAQDPALASQGRNRQRFTGMLGSGCESLTEETPITRK